MTIKHFLNTGFILSGRGQTTPHFVLPSSPPILGGDEGVVIKQSNHPYPSLSKEGRGIKGVVNCNKGVQG